MNQARASFSNFALLGLASGKANEPFGASSKVRANVSTFSETERHNSNRGRRRNPSGRDYSERRAWITSMRAARDAGSIEATTAAASSTKADTMTGNAPGIFRSPK